MIDDEDSSDSDTDELFLGYIDSNVNTINPDLTENTQVGNKGISIEFQLDTGARCNVLPKSLLNNVSKCYKDTKLFLLE